MSDSEHLPLPQQIALNYAPERIRPAAAALFGFDAKLAEIVAKASEPILAQVRMAWWRGELAKAPRERTADQGTLTRLSASWSGEEGVLIALVDGWECLLAPLPLAADDISAFTKARAGSFAALARLGGVPGAANAAAQAGTAWALADFYAQSSNEVEQDVACELGRALPARIPTLPRDLRHLAVLGGLGTRALARGHGPIIGGRRDILAALRLGMFGR